MQNKKLYLIGALLFGIMIFITAVWIQPMLRNNSSQQSAVKTALEDFSQQDIRLPAVAGQFYPENAEELNQMIDSYLSEAEIPEQEGIPQILIVPHAGYIFSGRVSAYAFKTLANRDFKRAIIIGRSHNNLFSGISADTHDFWETPLGRLGLDHDFIKLLKEKSSAVFEDSTAHENEHSLEVMLPFLIKTLGKEIKIVPLLFGEAKEETISDLAEALRQTIDQKTLIIISTDLSHYPAYNEAVKLDKKTIEAILDADALRFEKKIKELTALNVNQVVTLACAEPAVSTALMVAKALGLQPHLLKYANSGDYFPELKEKVVGYAAIVFDNLSIENLPENTFDSNDRQLNQEEQKIALQIARQTLEAAFQNKDYNYESLIADFPIFQIRQGAFVTLRKHGQLRGCIGLFEPEKSLAEVIKSMALAAAFNDKRFLPLASHELDEINIEISVLSPRKKISDHNIIEVGKHGVYVQRGIKSGVYLPQVATEQGWDKETFLNSLCEEKAGLEKDCWKNGSTDLYIFTAQIFRE